MLAMMTVEVMQTMALDWEVELVAKLVDPSVANSNPASVHRVVDHQTWV